jgi:hypothetical protein
MPVMHSCFCASGLLADSLPLCLPVLSLVLMLSCVSGWLVPVFVKSDAYILRAAGLDALVSAVVCVLRGGFLRQMSKQPGGNMGCP